MKKPPEPTLVTPITSNDYFPRYLYGMKVPNRWLKADWCGLAYIAYPTLKLSFGPRSTTDWRLYRKIKALADAVSAPFPNAAHWAVRKALGANFERARQMDLQKIPWDPVLQHVCRRYSLQLCKFCGRHDVHDIGLIDHMIYPLLLPDELLVHEMQPRNNLPC